MQNFTNMLADILICKHVILIKRSFNRNSLKNWNLFIYFMCQIKFSRGEIYKVSLSDNKDD